MVVPAVSDVPAGGLLVDHAHDQEYPGNRNQREAEMERQHGRRLRVLDCPGAHP